MTDMHIFMAFRELGLPWAFVVYAYTRKGAFPTLGRAVKETIRRQPFASLLKSSVGLTPR